MSQCSISVVLSVWKTKPPKICVDDGIEPMSTPFQPIASVFNFGARSSRDLLFSPEREDMERPTRILHAIREVNRNQRLSPQASVDGSTIETSSFRIDLDQLLRDTKRLLLPISTSMKSMIHTQEREAWLPRNSNLPL